METEEEKAARETAELKKAEDEKLALQKQEEEDLLKKQGEDNKVKADKLLDGTDKSKSIVVKKSSYDERNEKAKIYEAHAELLESVLQDPEAVQRFLAEKKENTGVERRLAELEEDRKAEKRAQMRDAVAELISEHPDFEKSWNEIEPIATTLIRQGYSIKAALRRGYIAAHPEAAEAEAKRIAEEARNREGEFRSSGLPALPKKTTGLSDNERKLAQGLLQRGQIKTEAEYEKILENHHDWIERQMRNTGE